MPGLVRNELHQQRIVHFLPCTLTSWNKQVVQRWALRERYVWIHGQALGTGDGLTCLTYYETVLGAIRELAPHREHFPRTDKVQLLDLIEDKNAKVHGSTPVHPVTSPVLFACVQPNTSRRHWPFLLNVFKCSCAHLATAHVAGVKRHPVLRTKATPSITHRCLMVRVSCFPFIAADWLPVRGRAADSCGP
jgi:hypothetical protein